MQTKREREREREGGREGKGEGGREGGRERPANDVDEVHVTVAISVESKALEDALSHGARQKDSQTDDVHRNTRGVDEEGEEAEDYDNDEKRDQGSDERSEHTNGEHDVFGQEIEARQDRRHVHEVANNLEHNDRAVFTDCLARDEPQDSVDATELRVDLPPDKIEGIPQDSRRRAELGALPTCAR
jgi:hypothetical protein